MGPGKLVRRLRISSNGVVGQDGREEGVSVPRANPQLQVLLSIPRLLQFHL